MRAGGLLDALGRDRDYVDLDQDALGERRADRCPHGERLGHDAAVSAVEGREVRQIRKVHRGLHDISQVRTGRSEHLRDVCDGLACLCATSPSIKAPDSGSIAACPAVNTSSRHAIPWLYAPAGAGASVVWMDCFSYSTGLPPSELLRHVPMQLADLHEPV